MRIKKTAEADLNNKRTLFTLIGLVLAFGFAYICFEWSDSKVEKLDEKDFVSSGNDEADVIDATTQEEEPEPEPEQIEEKVEEILEDALKVVEDDKVTTGDIKSTEGSLNDTIAPPPPPAASSSDDEEEEDKVIYTKVEKKAEFPGGKAELTKYLKKNLSYPQIAIDNNIQGNVVVKFVVSRTGDIKDVKVTRGVDPSLDDEAIRVVKSMPKWTPAEQRNKPCNSYFTLPVNFKLKDM